MASRTAAAIGTNQPIDLSLALAVVLLTGIDILNLHFFVNIGLVMGGIKSFLKNVKRVLQPLEREWSWRPSTEVPNWYFLNPDPSAPKGPKRKI
jgi:hypothetical protein